MIVNDLCGFVSIYQSYSASSSYLLELVKKLLDENYDLSLARHMLSQPYEILRFLNRIKLFSDLHLNLVRYIMSCPYNQSASIKLNHYKGLINEYNRIYSTNYNKDNFDFDIINSINPLNGLYQYTFKINKTGERFMYCIEGGFQKIEN